MVTPELRCPTTPATLVSTSFCATVVPTLGSAWSSSEIRSNCTSLPPIFAPAALASSIASRAPFSLSLPRWAIPPVSGATLPMTTETLPEAEAFLSSLQPEATARIRATAKNGMRVMAGSVAGQDDQRGQGLFQGHHELRQCLGFFVVDRTVRRHRDRAPHAGRSPLDLRGEIRFCVLARLVLGGDVLVGRPDELLVHLMAAQASLVLQKLLRVGGERRAARQREAERCRYDYEFHENLLGEKFGPCYWILSGLKTCATRSSSRSTGARQTVPSHTQALTRSPAGFASTGGRSVVALSIAITMVWGR